MRRRKPHLILLSVLALISGMAGLMSPAANALNGWETSPVTGYLHIPVWREGSSSGDANERLTKAECTSGGETRLAFGSNGGYRTESLDVYYSIGDTGAGIDSFDCTAWYDLYTVRCPLWCYDEFTASYPRYYSVGPFRVDLSRPTAEPVFVDGAVRNGWYRVPGTVRWRGSDPNSSSVAFCRSPYEMPAVNTSGTSVSGTCTDVAGNTSFPATAHWRLDMTAPTLAPTLDAASPIAVGSVVTATPHATDQAGLSGVESQGCDPVDTSTPGDNTVTCRAMDSAGNEASTELGYVVGYGFQGFASPVDNDRRNLAKAGRAVPLTFRVTAGDTSVLDLVGADVVVKATSLSCASGTTDDELLESTTGGSGLQNLGDGWYQLNWSTPKSYASSCKTLTVTLPDGIAHGVEFEFVK